MMIDWKIILKINPIKSIYYSIKSRGFILLGWGSKIYMGKNSKIRFLKKRTALYIGLHFNYPVSTIVDIHNNGKIIVGNSVSFNRGCKIVVGEHAELTIGDKSFINENSRLHCRKAISIGKQCAISWNVNILDTDEHGIYIDGQLINKNKNVKIGDNVWIGANSTILRGSLIECNCVVGANSLVKGKLQSNHIYVGNPIKEVRNFEYWGKIRQ